MTALIVRHDMLLLVLAIYVPLLVVGILAAVRPLGVNRAFRRALCALRLVKRTRLGTPIPRWRNVLTSLIGVLIVALVVSDARGLEFGTAAREVPVWESPTARVLDAAARKTIDKEALRVVRSGRSLGLVIGVVEGDNSALLGYGRKAIGGKGPPDGDTLFEIGSITKTFTATCLAIMAERGDVKLEDPVGRYLPASVHLPEYDDRRITLVDLATHTSGLPSVPGTLHWLQENPYASYTTEMMYDFLRAYKLTRAPGLAYEYSNMGMGLVGLGLSRRMGTSYEEMALSLVCRPLGMKDTVVTLAKAQRSRLANGYALQGRLGRLDVAVPVSPWDFHECFVGAGGIKSTGSDMLKYLRANMGLQPEAKALPFEMVQKRRHTVEPDGDMWIGLGWHGFGVDHVNGTIWHNGETGGYHSIIVFCRKQKIGAVILSNSTQDGDAIDSLGFTLLAAISKKD